MIYLVVLSALYALHLLLKLHWITTVVIGGFLLLRISGHRKWYKKKIVYELLYKRPLLKCESSSAFFLQSGRVPGYAVVCFRQRRKSGESTGECRCGDGGWSDARSSPKRH